MAAYGEAMKKSYPAMGELATPHNYSSRLMTTAGASQEESCPFRSVRVLVSHVHLPKWPWRCFRSRHQRLSCVVTVGSYHLPSLMPCFKDVELEKLWVKRGWHFFNAVYIIPYHGEGVMSITILNDEALLGMTQLQLHDGSVMRPCFIGNLSLSGPRHTKIQGSVNVHLEMSLDHAYMPSVSYHVVSGDKGCIADGDTPPVSLVTSSSCPHSVAKTLTQSQEKTNTLAAEGIDSAKSESKKSCIDRIPAPASVAAKASRGPLMPEGTKCLTTSATLVTSHSPKSGNSGRDTHEGQRASSPRSNASSCVIAGSKDMRIMPSLPPTSGRLGYSLKRPASNESSHFAQQLQTPRTPTKDGRSSDTTLPMTSPTESLSTRWNASHVSNKTVDVRTSSEERSEEQHRQPTNCTQMTELLATLSHQSRVSSNGAGEGGPRVPCLSRLPGAMPALLKKSHNSRSSREYEKRAGAPPPSTTTHRTDGLGSGSPGERNESSDRGTHLTGRPSPKGSPVGVPLGEGGWYNENSSLLETGRISDSPHEVTPLEMSPTGSEVAESRVKPPSSINSTARYGSNESSSCACTSDDFASLVLTVHQCENLLPMQSVQASFEIPRSSSRSRESSHPRSSISGHKYASVTSSTARTTQSVSGGGKRVVVMARVGNTEWTTEPILTFDDSPNVETTFIFPYYHSRVLRFLVAEKHFPVDSTASLHCPCTAHDVDSDLRFHSTGEDSDRKPDPCKDYAVIGVGTIDLSSDPVPAQDDGGSSRISHRTDYSCTSRSLRETSREGEQLSSFRSRTERSSEAVTKCKNRASWRMPQDTYFRSVQLYSLDGLNCVGQLIVSLQFVHEGLVSRENCVKLSISDGNHAAGKPEKAR